MSDYTYFYLQWHLTTGACGQYSESLALVTLPHDYWC